MQKYRVKRIRITPLREWQEAAHAKDRAKTQHWLADQLGISDSFMSDLLSGKAAPSLDLAVRIEALTGIPPRELAVA